MSEKCSLEKHSDIDAISFCKECNVFMCNKCFYNHSEFLKEKHHTYKIDKNFKEIFTGILKEENHKNELNYFCKDYNLCCADCINKKKGKGNDQHSECNIYSIDDIKNEKRNILKENIKKLEEFSKMEIKIKELKQIFEKMNKDKEELKMGIIKKFSQMRNAINEREDKLLSEIDNKFNLIIKEDNDLVKKSEQFPNTIKNSLIKGIKLNSEWDNSKEKINSKINDCIKIENSVKAINELNENIKNYSSQKS